MAAKTKKTTKKSPTKSSAAETFCAECVEKFYASSAFNCIGCGAVCCEHRSVRQSRASKKCCCLACDVKKTPSERQL